MEPLVSFVGVAAVAMLIPGPDTVVVLRAAVAQGPQAGRRAAAGSATGNLVWGSATVAGVAGLLATSAAAFSVLKLAGAAYLVLPGWPRAACGRARRPARKRWRLDGVAA